MFIRISVLKNQNIDKIEERINNLFFENAGLVEQDATYLSNARHISLIEKAVESLQAVNEGLELGMPVDLLQVDLTRTWEILGEITGDAAPDELITQLFQPIFVWVNKKKTRSKNASHLKRGWDKKYPDLTFLLSIIIFTR